MREDKTVDVMFNPPESWKGIVTSGEFLKVWFASHGIVRRSPELGSISASCIQQICSMKGSCLHEHETEAQWAAAMIELFRGNLPNWMPAQVRALYSFLISIFHFSGTRVNRLVTCFQALYRKPQRSHLDDDRIVLSSFSFLSRAVDVFYD